MLIAFFTGYGVGVVRFSLEATSTCFVPIGHQKVATDRDAGRMKKLPEPCNKPFILGLADEILGLRARFFIWLPFTTHPAELRARRDSCQMAQWLRFTIHRKEQNDYAKIYRTGRPQAVH